jgi:hypothetical protein
MSWQGLGVRAFQQSLAFEVAAKARPTLWAVGHACHDRIGLGKPMQMRLLVQAGKAWKVELTVTAPKALIFLALALLV